MTEHVPPGADPWTAGARTGASAGDRPGPASVPGSPPGDAAARTVLLVEDNEDNRAIYATMLQHHGYTVLEAADGEQAIRLAREHGPEVIVLDISLPGIDGWAVAERLKREARTAATPIVVVTAHAMPEDRERARSLGCEGYLSKPVRPRRVLEEVQRYTGG